MNNYNESNGSLAGGVFVLVAMVSMFIAILVLDSKEDNQTENLKNNYYTNNIKDDNKLTEAVLIRLSLSDIDTTILIKDYYKGGSTKRLYLHRMLS